MLAAASRGRPAVRREQQVAARPKQWSSGGRVSPGCSSALATRRQTRSWSRPAASTITRVQAGRQCSAVAALAS